MYGNVCGETKARIFPATLPSFLHPPPPLSAPPARPGPRTLPHFFEARRDFRLGFRQPPPSDLFDPLLVKFMSGRCSSRPFPESALATFPTFSLSIFGSQLLAISRPCPFCLSSPPSEVCRALIRPQTRGRFPDQPSRHCFQRAWPTLVLSQWPLTSRFFPFFPFRPDSTLRDARITNTEYIQSSCAQRGEAVFFPAIFRDRATLRDAYKRPPARLIFMLARTSPARAAAASIGECPFSL